MKKRALIVALGVAATVTAIVFASESRLNKGEAKCGNGRPPEPMASQIQLVRDVVFSSSYYWCSAGL